MSIGAKLLIPISAVPTVLGGIAWLTSLHHTSQANAQEIEKIKANAVYLVEKIESVDRRISKMEGQVEYIYNQTRRYRLIPDKLHNDPDKK